MDREQKLEQALSLLADREDAYETACKEFASAESEYRIELSKAFLKAQGSVEARKAQSIIDVQVQLRERDRTEAVKEFTKEKLKDCQTAVFARQSLLNADVRTNRAVG